MSAPEPLYEPWITMQPANLLTGHDWVETRDAAWEDAQGRLPHDHDHDERTTEVTSPTTEVLLRHGNAIRAAAAAELNVIRAASSRRDGARAAAALLRDAADGPNAGTRVSTLLRAIRGVGDGTTRRLTIVAGIPDTRRRLRELTERQRNALADALEAM